MAASTQVIPNDPSEAPDSGGTGRASQWLRALTRLPFTIALTLAFYGIALATGAMFRAADQLPWFTRVATGLPQFTDGLWYTVLTSPFVATPPSTYLIIAPVLIGGVGWAEWRFGSLRTLGLFAAGHIVSVFLSAGIVLAISQGDWPWAHAVAEHLDVGPSAGAFTCLAFVLATLPSPWRLRARVALGTWAGIEVLFMGQLSNLEHAVAIALGLLVSGWLPAFRHPAGRPSAREWRMLAFAGLLIIGVVQIIDLAVPYDGPLGHNSPAAGALDVALDVAFILIIANGIRIGVKVAWIITLAVGMLNVLLSIVGTALVPALLAAALIGHPSDVLGIVLADGVLWLGLVIILLIGRSAFQVPLRRSKRGHGMPGITRDDALDRLRNVGGGTISWMIGWSPNRYLPVGDGVVGYQEHAGVVIGLGDPVARPGKYGVALQSFNDAAVSAGLIPCVFSASDLSAEAKPAGWRSVIVAEDTIVDLQDFALTGKKWQPVRTSVNRAAREGIEFRMCTLADEPWGVRAQVRAISEQWTGDKGLPEMGFTLGTVEEALDPETKVGIAVDADGNLHGITSWLPVYGGEGKVRGWTLDLMRRRDGGFGPVMEFLIAASAMQLSEEGYEFLSLSGAPLVRPADAASGPVDRVLAGLGELIEPLYGFRSLHHFKQKFNPRAATLHLLYRDEGDLPRIALALTKAYLPDATLRDLLASAADAAPKKPTAAESTNHSAAQ